MSRRVGRLGVGPLRVQLQADTSERELGSSVSAAAEVELRVTLLLEGGTKGVQAVCSACAVQMHPAGRKAKEPGPRVLQLFEGVA